MHSFKSVTDLDVPSDIFTDLLLLPLLEESVEIENIYIYFPACPQRQLCDFQSLPREKVPTMVFLSQQTPQESVLTLYTYLQKQAQESVLSFLRVLLGKC